MEWIGWVEVIEPKVKAKKKSLKDDRPNTAAHTTKNGKGKIARLRDKK